MNGLSIAENLLSSFGVTEPKEIDLEAIAFHCGAFVKYRPLEGCEARIIGGGNRAIISINNRSQRRRKRFSIGHELGHWKFDRGKGFVCKKDAIGAQWSYRTDPEAIANAFAADLLLPKYLFHPLAKDRALDFATTSALGDLSQTSLTATAIRLIKYGSYPGILVCHGFRGRKWYVSGPDVPQELRPHRELHHDTDAFEILFSSKNGQSNSTTIGSDAWIDHRFSNNYVVQEHSLKIADDTVISLIWWKDESQILDLNGE